MCFCSGEDGATLTQLNGAHMANIKRIALFLDGTWNNVSDNTNVWRLKSLCAKTPEQVVYYSAGVGTQRGERFTGGMFGIGINDEVTDAYEWLVEHYEPEAQIFIFGFSRGAFTARSLAGFISRCGLLKPGSPISLKQVFERYRKQNVPNSIATLQKLADDGLSFEDRRLKEYSRPIEIWFQGIWDTVGSLGVSLPFMPHISKEDFAFLETDLHINHRYAYHALAIDEHRKAFAPTLWTKKTTKQDDDVPPRTLDQVEQRWFVGAHANVGGGYEDDLLAQIPLGWLMQKAISKGLVFTDNVVIDGDETVCSIRDSYKEMADGFYELITAGQRHYRPVGVDPEDVGDAIVTTINESIDATVFERWRMDTMYRPQNIDEWAKRRGLNPADCQGTVLAKDVSPVPTP